MGEAAVVRMHLAQALTRLDDADARDHVEAALTALQDSSQDSVSTCPWCGLRGVPSRINMHDCPNRSIDDAPDMAARTVSASLDLAHVDDHTTVSVRNHASGQDAGATLAVSTGVADLHVTLHMR
jgi:hypothetical protein